MFVKDFPTPKRRSNDLWGVSGSLRVEMEARKKSRDELTGDFFSSCGDGPGRDEAAVKVQVVVDHALGGKALARPCISEVAVGAALVAVGIEFADVLGQTCRIIRAEIERRVSPDFAEAGNIVRHNGAP